MPGWPHRARIQVVQGTDVGMQSRRRRTSPVRAERRDPGAVIVRFIAHNKIQRQRLLEIKLREKSTLTQQFEKNSTD